MVRGRWLGGLHLASVLASHEAYFFEIARQPLGREGEEF